MVGQEESFAELAIIRTQHYISLQSQMINMLDIVISMFGNIRGIYSDAEKKQRATSQELSELIGLVGYFLV